MCVYVLFADTTIGFTAKLRFRRSDHHNKPVIYDVVETNTGSGYSTTTGILTAPVDGTYVFILHAMAYNSCSGWCDLYLYRNGAQLLFTAYADSNGRTGGSDSASNSAVLTLDIVDTVGIRTGSYCGYMYERPWMSFSGFKI